MKKITKKILTCFFITLITFLLGLVASDTYNFYNTDYVKVAYKVATDNTYDNSFTIEKNEGDYACSIVTINVTNPSLSSNSPACPMPNCYQNYPAYSPEYAQSQPNLCPR